MSRPGQAIGGTRWRHARLVVQATSMALFFLLAALTYRGSEFLLPLDLYIRLDPLVAWAALTASRTITVGLLLSVASVGLAFLFGRAWCGWLCPFGAILDAFSPREPHKTETHTQWRAAKYLLLFTIVVAAFMGNLTFILLDPITILNRTVAGAILPALNVLQVGTETALYPLEPLRPPLEWIEQNARGTILPAQQTFYQTGVLLALFLTALVALNRIASRFWCRYLCPLGAVYAVQARVALLRPRSSAACDHCAQCLRVCPTGAITVDKTGMSIDPSECVLCLDCTTVCPQSAVRFSFGGEPSAARPLYSLSRRHFVESAALGLGAVALFRSAPAARRPDPALVRPPGASENEFLATCVRCGECTKACPTGGLQPSLFQSGWEGIWTPVLVPRLGYCDFSCNACGQICPTGAIPPLPLQTKRETVIGTAYLDQNRCIPWSSYRPCIVCQEMCPLADKAIKLDEVDVTAPDGTPVHLQRPRVQHDLCIGCGICEYQCPLPGRAAIQVQVPTLLPPKT